MPYRRTASLRGTGRYSKRPRRRVGVSTSKIRYQRPTARNQRSQIYRNARVVNTLARNQARHRVWSDYQYTGALPSTAFQWGTIRLTDFDLWNNVLRADAAVTRKAHTFIQRCQLNLRFNLNDAAFLGVNLFIVTPRKFSDVDPWSTPLILNQDFIEPAQSQGFNLRLNSGLFKCHFATYKSLTKSSLGQQSDPLQNVGSPSTTWSKAQVNLKLNLSVTNPVARSGLADTWMEIPFDSLPYYEKFYLLSYPTWAFNAGGTNPPFIGFDALFTCINSS